MLGLAKFRLKDLGGNQSGWRTSPLTGGEAWTDIYSEDWKKLKTAKTWSKPANIDSTALSDILKKYWA
ncbi:MAG: hypothetical protein LBC27_01680 [Spirochaetaceae bacterium]|nr:hypothetical protein [Spirochaetaceae bacterium]